MGGNLPSAEIARRMAERMQPGNDGGMKRKWSREKKKPNQTKEITGKTTQKQSQGGNRRQNCGYIRNVGCRILTSPGCIFVYIGVIDRVFHFLIHTAWKIEII